MHVFSLMNGENNRVYCSIDFLFIELGHVSAVIGFLGGLVVREGEESV